VRSIQSTLFSLLLASTTTYANTYFNLTQGVSPVSHDVYELHMTIFWICVVIGVLVFGAMIYSIIHHRKSRGAKPAEFHSHPILEITWTVIPFIILVVMAIPATKVLVNMNNVDQEDLTIKISGYQWKWHYEYLEDGVSFFSNLATPYEEIQNKSPKSINYLREVDKPLVVPIHKKIRFLITSNDVNHAWWVPDLGVKRDAIPGFINEGWTIIDKPGTYIGQCAELCGINHAFMPIVVVATTEEGYKDWINQQKGGASQAETDTNKQWTLEELKAQGEKVYSRVCSACHQPNGVGMPPTFPALKGSKVANGAIEDHIRIVMDGKTGTAMQAFKGQLSAVELAGIISYERNAFGNNKGDYVQPVQIKALQSGMAMAEALKMQPGKTPGQAPATAPAKGPEATKQQQKLPPTQGPTAPTTAQTTVDAKTNAQDDLKALMAQGEKLYMNTCAVCHQPSGTGIPPTFPALKGSKIATGPLKDHLQIVLFGKTGTAMQAFKDQLTAEEIAAIITYERNAWTNNTGDIVKPEVVKAHRLEQDTKQ
jgi:cytochrome c oxidase subunit II